MMRVLLSTTSLAALMVGYGSTCPHNRPGVVRTQDGRAVNVICNDCGNSLGLEKFLGRFKNKPVRAA